LVLAAVTLVSALAGCGGERPPAAGGLPRQSTVPVAGTVRHAGKPVANATLALRSADGVILARGRSDAEGRFAALATYAPDDGAPPGRYRVMVAVSGATEIEPGVLAPEPPGGFVSPIPLKYAQFETSDLEVEIPAAGTSELVIDLE